MPIIANATFQVKANEDFSINLLQEIKKSGCACIETLARQLAIPEDKAKETLKTLTDSGQVACNEDNSVCCADSETLHSFIAKLHKLRGI